MTASGPIFVVHDDASIREAIADCLELQGYNVRVAGDAPALDLLKARRPGLIFLE
jgi:two-component system OmpR family response regulator